MSQCKMTLGIELLLQLKKLVSQNTIKSMKSQTTALIVKGNFRMSKQSVQVIKCDFATSLSGTKFNSESKLIFSPAEDIRCPIPQINILKFLCYPNSSTMKLMSLDCKLLGDRLILSKLQYLQTCKFGQYNHLKIDTSSSRYKIVSHFVPRSINQPFFEIEI